MNPLTNVKNQQKLTLRELELGLTNKKSWHDKYKDSAWIFVGGLPYDLTEGDIICVFSQYGEIVNINLVRDKKTGKSKGFCFICYEDQRSTILSVDNLNGIKLLGRVLRVDHVEEYRKPKEHGDEDEVTMKLRQEGCAPQVPKSPDPPSSEEDPMPVVKKEKVKKEKSDKKKKKKKKKKRSRSESDSSSDEDRRERHGNVNVKKEKHDPGYDRALQSSGGTKREYSGERNSDRQKLLRSDNGHSDTSRYSEDRNKYRDRDDRETDRRRNESSYPSDRYRLDDFEDYPRRDRGYDWNDRGNYKKYERDRDQRRNLDDQDMDRGRNENNRHRHSRK